MSSPKRRRRTRGKARVNYEDADDTSGEHGTEYVPKAVDFQEAKMEEAAEMEMDAGEDDLDVSDGLFSKGEPTPILVLHLCLSSLSLFRALSLSLALIFSLSFFIACRNGRRQR